MNRLKKFFNNNLKSYLIFLKDKLIIILKKLNKFRKRHPVVSFTVYFILGVILIFNIMNIIFPLPLDKIENGYSDTVVFDDELVNYVSLSKYKTLRIYTPYKKIPKRVKQYFLTYEDKYFYFHPGVNPIAAARAMFINMQNKKIVSGASTITMQIARMIEPKERSFSSKIIETFRALQLEVKYSKRELLEIYLNMIPLGGNIEGIGAASYYYFGKNSDALSVGETALLIGIPQSPNFARPDLYPMNSIKVRNKILKRLLKYKKISENEYKSACKTKPEGRRYYPPFIAPHLTLRLLEERKGDRLINISLDRDIQYLCKNIASKNKERLYSQGIKNIAIIVVENKTGKILSWIGNHEYENSDESMIDCISIKRSPGSTLKPFIYGKAVDAGIITPKYILYDIKRYYAGYKVENYDKKYRGPVTATVSLNTSLNSTAVDLLEKLNKGSLYPILHSLGFKEISNRESLGLSIILGAKEISLFDLVRNYTSFSNKGRIKDIYYSDKHIKYKKNRLLSGEAAFLINQMLSEGARVDLPRSWEFTRSMARVAWKTGTSYGNYDALCIGYNKDITIGVWTGNADRTPSKGLVGLEASGPVFFEIFNALSQDYNNWFIRPDSIKVRQVSAESGKLPTENSKHLIYDYYIPGVSTMETCDRYKAFYIDEETGLAVSESKNRKVKKVVMEVYPKEVVNWAKENILSYEDPPALDPRELKNINVEGHITILSPLTNKTYFINPYMSYNTQKIPLIAQVYPDSENLYWFFDGILISQGEAENKFYLDPEIGEHTLMCMDSKGRSGVVTVEIKSIN